MAVMEQHGGGNGMTSPDLVRDRIEGWQRFTHFAKIATAGIAVLLILMALFLL